MAHGDRILGMAAAGAAALALALPVAATPAAGPPAGRVPLAWSTYLRAGPGQTFAAVTELEHDTPVTVGACAGGWCRVSTDTGAGYVDQDALTLPRTLAPQPPVRNGCVVAPQADDGAPPTTLFCSGPAKAR